MQPFKTIQHAISVVEGLTSGLFNTIYINSGVYTENLTVWKSNIGFVGQGKWNTSIIGNITIQPNSNAPINLCSLSITGQITMGGAIYASTFNIRDCYITGHEVLLVLSGLSGFVANVINSTLEGDGLSGINTSQFLINVLAKTTLNLSNVYINSKNTQGCLSMYTTSAITQCDNVVFRRTLSADSSNPLFAINGMWPNPTSSNITFNHCRWEFSDGTAKTGNNIAILSTNPVNDYIYLNNCFFNLSGISSSSGTNIIDGTVGYYYTNNGSYANAGTGYKIKGVRSLGTLL